MSKMIKWGGNVDKSDTFLTEGGVVGFDMTDSFDEVEPEEDDKGKDTGKGYTRKVFDYLVREGAILRRCCSR